MRITGIIKQTGRRGCTDTFARENGLRITVIRSLPDSVVVEFLDVDKPGTLDKICSWFAESNSFEPGKGYSDGTLLIYSFRGDDLPPSEKQTEPTYCQDPRHGQTPCVLPCAGCETDCNQPSPESELTTPFDGTHNSLVIKATRSLNEYFRPITAHPVTFDCSAYSVVQNALKEAWAKQSVSEPVKPLATGETVVFPCGGKAVVEEIGTHATRFSVFNTRSAVAGTTVVVGPDSVKQLRQLVDRLEVTYEKKT